MNKRYKPFLRVVKFLSCYMNMQGVMRIYGKSAFLSVVAMPQSPEQGSGTLPHGLYTRTGL